MICRRAMFNVILLSYDFCFLLLFFIFVFAFVFVSPVRVLLL